MNFETLMAAAMFPINTIDTNTERPVKDEPIKQHKESSSSTDPNALRYVFDR